MRDYRDAKVMAQTLRKTLKSRSIEVSHSESLELIAKTLGFKDWNVLSARIGAEEAPALSEPPPAAKRELHCSFCGKSQHVVRKMIAGPQVFICNECVVLCEDILAREEAADVPNGGAELEG